MNNNAGRHSGPHFELHETGGGRTVSADGRYLLSSRNPAARPQRAAQSIQPESNCIYYLPSPILGYGLRELLEKLPESSHVLALEASALLFSLYEPHIPEDLRHHPRVSWICFSDTEVLHSHLSDLGFHRFRRIRRIGFSGGERLNPEVYGTVETFLGHALGAYWRNRHAIGGLGRQWARHALANVRSIASSGLKVRSLSSLKAAGVPFVAGAGPSLQSSMDFIRGHRDKLWLLAVDTALPALRAYGIVPDAVMALETQAWNMLDFHGSLGSGVPIIADITAYPQSLSVLGGEVYLFSTDIANLDWLERMNRHHLRPHRLPPLGSVGLTAVEAALSVGEGPVFLSGLDFAYAPGLSHLRGSSIHAWWTCRQCRLNPMPDFTAAMGRKLTQEQGYSGPVGTDSVLKGYARLLTDRYGGNSRLHVMEPGGLNLGLPLVTVKQAGEFMSGLHAGLQPPKNAAAPLLKQEQAFTAADAAAYIHETLERFENIVRCWDRYASGKGAADEVRRALEGMDDIYGDFPDLPPLPSDDVSFLNRAVLRTRGMIRYLRR